MSDLPKAGQTYRHYKGGIYVVICLARDVDDSDRRHVVYQAKDGQTGKGETWVRPLSEWMESVPIRLADEYEWVLRFVLLEDAL